MFELPKIKRTVITERNCAMDPDEFILEFDSSCISRHRKSIEHSRKFTRKRTADRSMQNET